jgi:hypothetical protein
MERLNHGLTKWWCWHDTQIRHRAVSPMRSLHDIGLWATSMAMTAWKLRRLRMRPGSLAFFPFERLDDSSHQVAYSEQRLAMSGDMIKRNSTISFLSAGKPEGLRSHIFPGLDSNA